MAGTNAVIIGLVAFSSICALAQPPKGGSSSPAGSQAGTGAQAQTGTGNIGNSNSGSNAGSGALQGISWARDSWDTLTLPTYEDLGLKNAKDVVILCYDLVPAYSGTQPFILQPAKEVAGEKCYNVNPTNPLKMNNVLVFAISMKSISEATWERFKILNVNITNQQGSPLNPTPIRPGLSAGTASGPAVAYDEAIKNPAKKRKQDIYFFAWPNQIPGDAILTVSVNLVYTPVAPALPYKADIFYPAGSIVIADVPITPPPANPPSSITNGHYYVALNSGTSTANMNSVGPVIPITTLKEGTGLSWKDRGPVALSPTPPTWKANTPYAAGALVTTDQNTHYYEAQAPGGGTSAGTAPSFKVDGTTFQDGGVLWLDKGLTSFVNPVPPTWQQSTAYSKGALVSTNPSNGHYYEAMTAGATAPNAPAFPVDGTSVTESTGIVWVDVGSTMPANAKLKTWATGTAYFVGDVVQNAVSGHYYYAAQPGISCLAGCTNSPDSAVVPGPQEVTVGPITWQDLGTTLPSSVSVAAPPNDQTVNILTYTFPQAHMLSRFNLASGVVVSSVKTRSFVNPGSGSGNTWSTAIGGRIVDPILALTAYALPMDAERPWHLSDLTPGITVAFSLTSPSTNFYFGGSSELFIRNLQAVYGLALIKVSQLDPPIQTVGQSQPTTRQVFAKGAFLGISLNITGFLQSLF